MDALCSSMEADGSISFALCSSMEADGSISMKCFRIMVEASTSYMEASAETVQRSMDVHGSDSSFPGSVHRSFYGSLLER